VYAARPFVRDEPCQIRRAPLRSLNASVAQRFDLAPGTALPTARDPARQLTDALLLDSPRADRARLARQ
jgi:hypothetical protein